MSEKEMEQQTLECTQCGHIHDFQGRKPVRVDIETRYYCPKCGEESYYHFEAETDLLTGTK